MSIRNAFAALAVLTFVATVHAAPPVKCKKGEVLVVVKDRVESAKAIRVVLNDAKSGKLVADFETAKAFEADVAKYVKGQKACFKEEGDM